MLDYLRMGRVLETDIDDIITAAGGQRFSEDHSKEKILNCDYQLEDCLIELKIIEEEGLEKEERQKKLADLFEENQPGRPTVIVDPTLLDESGQKRYYQIMSTPIKTAVKKAAKQLDESSKKVDVAPCRVLLLINNGYAALSHEEFQDIALKRASLDTSRIDAVVVAGIYYYSDSFDSYAFLRFNAVSLNINKGFKHDEKLRTAWNAFGKRFMTDFIVAPEARDRDRTPVMDFEYSLDGIRYVKPAPPMGKPSDFFPHGRPRENSTGLELYPPVAHTFPLLDVETWSLFKEKMPSSCFFEDNYREWCDFQTAESEKRSNPLKPFVPVALDFDEFNVWVSKMGLPIIPESVCEFAADRFTQRVKKLIDQAVSQKESRLVIPDIILLVVEEIGQDKANDYGSIVRIRNFGDGPQEEERLVENKRFTYEHGLALAAAYAIKLGVAAVMHYRSRKYIWE